MNRYLLDTSALLALRDDETGANEVANMLAEVQQGKAICFASFITLMELFYRVWKDEGEPAGRFAYEQAQALPISWVHEDRSLLEKAAELKATLAISLADAWIAASAILQGATLVHKDPELARIDYPQYLL